MTNRKTNVMRLLDTIGVIYKMLTYDKKDNKVDGISVAKKINRNEDTVFKTLVAHGDKNEIYVFVIPVADELDLKKVAKVVGEKKVEMIKMKDLLNLTGYVHGGCSPIGMRKLYPTFIDESAKKIPEIVVSGGKIGSQIALNPFDLQKTVKAKFAQLIK